MITRSPYLQEDFAHALPAENHSAISFFFGL